MEIALGSAALVGVGLVWNRINSQTPPADILPMNQNRTVVKRSPEAVNVRSNPLANARARGPVPGILSGDISGRRDHSNFSDKPSHYEQQMSRVYRPQDGTKREVLQELDPNSKQDNIFVRSHTGYQEKFFQELQKPNKMHNVNPIATTSGTASQLVGPGLNVGLKQTGDHGLHYGMLRMKPNITEHTYREQKGSIIPGKNPIDKRAAEVNLMTHAASSFSISPSGFGKSEESNPEPLKFHAVSTNYLTSAPGRAVVTGNPGAGGARLEPVKDNTNRGSNNNHWGIHSTPGLEAPDSRQAYTRHDALSTDRGKQNEFVGIAKGAGVSRSGHQRVIDNFIMPSEARNTTEIAKGGQLLNINNPGQTAGVLNNNQQMQTTQRQTMQANGVHNLAPQLPGMPGDVGDVTRNTSRLPNEFRPGGASLAATPDMGGQGNQYGAYSSGQLGDRTQRESMENNTFMGPLKSVGVAAPMSYADTLKSEGYSNRDLPQLGFVSAAGPPGGTSVQTAGIGHFDQPPDAPNAVRNAGGGISNQSMTNFHIVNQNLGNNPNKVERQNQRLDTQILTALSQNHLRISA
jgi:hypothetical protein